jgi:hypothetical protein
MMNIYILLHGLFFLEYKPDDLLYVTAPFIPSQTSPPPPLMGHDYRIGNPEDGPSLQKVPPNAVLYWTGKLKGTPRNDFPDQMLQFHKGEAGTGDISDDPTQFAFRLILPSPDNIFPLRKGQRSDLPVIKTGSVWSNITKHFPSEPHMALVTCLQYHGDSEPSGSNTNRCHFYAEGDCPEDVPHANHAYDEAKRIFSVGFDLKLKQGSGTPTTVPVLPPAVEDARLTDLKGRDQDEFSLADFFANASGIKCPPPSHSPLEGVNVANCGQFGVLS